MLLKRQMRLGLQFVSGFQQLVCSLRTRTARIGIGKGSEMDTGKDGGFISDFMAYRHRFRLEDVASCPACQHNVEYGKYVFFHCPRFREEQETLRDTFIRN
ncbi:hypothetical protein J6590_063898 [Homalodisca vitripennis]|nr:hypothetical protein J6590_063898 [Homalodisca vitripennis]